MAKLASKQNPSNVVAVGALCKEWATRGGPGGALDSLKIEEKQ
jgi:hypothetical protein